MVVVPVTNFPRSAVVPAAGMGTRFLPITKSVPKELLPVVDTPGIELVASEAAQAGAQRLFIISSPGKEAVVNYFNEDVALEEKLLKAGKNDLVAKVKRAPSLIKVQGVEQSQPLGLGHAVAQVQPLLDDDEDAIAVLLPDDLVLPSGVLSDMAKVRQQLGGSVLCAFEVPENEISAYGIFDVQASTDVIDGVDVRRVIGMVEKPKLADAPSNLAAAGRYILDREIFSALAQIAPGAGGELQLTDAIDFLINQGHPVHVVVHKGKRHDLGNPPGYIRAVVDFALENPKIGPEFLAWLQARIS